MPLSADDTIQMAKEIALGVSKEHSRVPMDAEASAKWDRLVGQIEELRREGIAVDLPFDAPLLD